MLSLKEWMLSSLVVRFLGFLKVMFLHNFWMIAGILGTTMTLTMTKLTRSSPRRFRTTATLFSQWTPQTLTSRTELQAPLHCLIVALSIGLETGQTSAWKKLLKLWSKMSKSLTRALSTNALEKTSREQSLVRPLSLCTVKFRAWMTSYKNLQRSLITLHQETLSIW